MGVLTGQPLGKEGDLGSAIRLGGGILDDLRLVLEHHVPIIVDVVFAICCCSLSRFRLRFRLVPGQFVQVGTKLGPHDPDRLAENRLHQIATITNHAIFIFLIVGLASLRQQQAILPATVVPREQREEFLGRLGIVLPNLQKHIVRQVPLSLSSTNVAGDKGQDDQGRHIIHARRRQELIAQVRRFGEPNHLRQGQQIGTQIGKLGATIFSVSHVWRQRPLLLLFGRKDRVAERRSSVGVVVATARGIAHDIPVCLLMW
mmetsp:Transcript_6430/g.18398  ORF Transcript_6430/g.18398 Transcript_6430/m.18398 type:complete len:259 (+) Transcript_6430:1770-2546(+)